MLIRLDVSLIALANSGEVGRGVVRDALNMLAIARKEGNHFIYGEIDVVKQLKKLPLLNELTYSILNRVLTRFSEKAAMHDRLSTSVIVGDFVDVSVNIVGKKTAISFPVSKVNISFVQKTFLLVENLADAKLYRILNKSTAIGSIPVDFEAYPGGGNTTANALQHIAELNRMCVCIVDSDVRYPGGPHGETAKKVVATSGKIAPSLTTHYVLPVSSVENLIPLPTLERAIAEDAAQVARVKNLKSIYNDTFWPYFGLKRGIKCGDVVHKTKPAEVFWSEKVGLNPLLGACLETAMTSCVGKKCDVFLLNSLGSNTLESAIELLEKERVFIDAPTIGPVKQGWDDVSELLTAWCCSGAPVFAA